MYEMLLAAHSHWRWVVLAAIGARVVWAGYSWARGRAWGPTERRFSAIATGLADLQAVMGIALWLFFSPTVRAALADPGAAMGDRLLRFAFVEHPTMMIVGLVLMHVASVRARRATSDAAGHRTDAIGFALGLLCVLAGLPR